MLQHRTRLPGAGRPVGVRPGTYGLVYRDELQFFFFQAEDGIRDLTVTGVQTCALPISGDERNAECKKQNANVNRGLLQPRNTLGRDRDKETKQELSEPAAREAAQHSEDRKSVV